MNPFLIILIYNYQYLFAVHWRDTPLHLFGPAYHLFEPAYHLPPPLYQILLPTYHVLSPIGPIGIVWIIIVLRALLNLSSNNFDKTILKLLAPSVKDAPANKNLSWISEDIKTGEIKNTIERRYYFQKATWDRYDRTVLKIRSETPVESILKEITEMAYMKDVRILNELIQIVINKEHVLNERTTKAYKPALKALAHQIRYPYNYSRKLLAEHCDKAIISSFIYQSKDKKFIPILNQHLKDFNKYYEEWINENRREHLKNAPVNQFHLNRIIAIEDMLEQIGQWS